MSSPDARPAGPPLVPHALAVAAAWAWRALVVAALVVVVGRLLLELYVVTVPVILAAFGAAALEPLAAGLKRRGWPSSVSAAAVLLVALAAVAVLVWWLSTVMTGRFSEIGLQAREALDQVEQWVTRGPLTLSEQRVSRFEQQLVETLGAAGAGGMAQQVLTGARAAVEVLGGLVLMVFVVFFLLMDGDGMADWIRDRTPDRWRDDVSAIGRLVTSVLRHFLLGTAVVGLFDGAMVGLGLWLLDVPLALPLAVITAAGAFFPLVGAVVAGGLAAGVALVAQGPATALLVIALTVLVQQIEGNLLQPVIVGRAVDIHPVVTAVTVAGGLVLGGLLGAFLAVPLVGSATRVGHWYRTREEPRGAAAVQRTVGT